MSAEPIKEFPLSHHDDELVRSVQYWTQFFSVIYIAIGLTLVGAGLFIISYYLLSIIAFILAVLSFVVASALHKSSESLKELIETSSADQLLFIDAISGLKTFFKVNGLTLITAIIILLIAVLFAFSLPKIL